MFVRTALPFVLIGLVALLVLILVLLQLRKSRDIARKERLAAEERWQMDSCEFDNPKTGARCTRGEFHLENHYREVNGHLVTW